MDAGDFNTDRHGERLKVGDFDPDFSSYIQQKLKELSALPHGWDGYGAPPIRREILDAARKLTEDISPDVSVRPRIVPLSSGNLQFQWRVGTRELEIEFEGEGRLHYLRWQPDGGIEEEDVYPVTDIQRTEWLIRWVLADG